ncbi:uncharacterized protein BDR25DRAFT_365337 [Lindgomyces ingoldianus]|uniref:Uncharacterized protein n=1 Tax=Lindgomyces ingoldianus TaxID=673940 RepID=A0ACB6RGN6_9PLEO|nr:uncharacterized protein BDR25DRAFT_365337 [Lindgomyces ingoldianus]KAF2478215.1 hypothetical protein BDR25DRAFT_365337 [Lindgomyces ingoldianus]
MSSYLDLITSRFSKLTSSSSTETSWITEMVSCYQKMAKSTGAIIIPASSLSSSPSDLLAWLTASRTHEITGKGVKRITSKSEVITKGTGGGSLITLLSMAQCNGVRWLWNPDKNYMVAAKANETPKKKKGSYWRIFWGFKKVEDLGTMTSLIGVSNIAIVTRSNPSITIVMPWISSMKNTHLLPMPSPR